MTTPFLCCHHTPCATNNLGTPTLSISAVPGPCFLHLQGKTPPNFLQRPLFPCRAPSAWAARSHTGISSGVLLADDRKSLQISSPGLCSHAEHPHLGQLAPTKGFPCDFSLLMTKILAQAGKSTRMQPSTGPVQLPPRCFKFNFPCLLFNLMYSFDLSSSPFSCLPEFADTGEA